MLVLGNGGDVQAAPPDVISLLASSEFLPQNAHLSTSVMPCAPPQWPPRNQRSMRSLTAKITVLEPLCALAFYLSTPSVIPAPDETAGICLLRSNGSSLRSKLKLGCLMLSVNCVPAPPIAVARVLLPAAGSPGRFSPLAPAMSHA